jgi:flavodoxin
MKKNSMIKAVCMLLTGVIIMVSNVSAKDSVNGSAKTLVVYFSRAGENYNVGFLKTGNTAVIAEYIHERLSGSDIFIIEPAIPYPDKYNECTEVAKKEKNENARPVIKSHIPDINKYDIIYIGYPIWWGTMPQIIFTFLEEYNLSGKTIIPFCTHEGSSFGSSNSDLRKKCPKSKFIEGLAVRGSDVKKAQKEVNAWVDKTIESLK